MSRISFGSVFLRSASLALPAVVLAVGLFAVALFSAVSLCSCDGSVDSSGGVTVGGDLPSLSGRVPAVSRGSSQIREFEVSEAWGASYRFDVSVDSQALGVMPVDEMVSYSPSLSPGTHTLSVYAEPIPGGDYDTKVEVDFVEGNRRPVFFPEPQAVSGICKFEAHEGHESVGKDMANCRIRGGETITLQVQVGADL